MDKSSSVLLICSIYFVVLIITGIFSSIRNRKTSDYLVAGKLRKKESYVPLDFYEIRYGSNRWVRIWAWASNVPSLLGIYIAQLLACGSILSGFGIPFYTGVVVCAIVILIYSTLGGMWGVAMADFIHTFVIIVSIPVMAIASALMLKGKGIELGNVFGTPFIPHGTFAKFIYLVLPFLIAISVSYDAYIRYQAAKNARTAKWGCIIAGVMLPEIPASTPIVINEEICTGCNRCVDICQVDIFIPNPDKKERIPLIIYPGECWYCGCCVMVCPEDGAIQLRHPLMNQVNWIEKSELTKT